MSDFKTLDDFEFDGKTVLVRADLNVPTKDGVVTDTTRIDRLAPTLTELSQAGAKVVVLSHFGRPKGGPDEKYSLKQVVDAVSKAVGQKVAFAPDCVGPVAKEALAKIHPGAIIVLENLRFHLEEEKNDPAFAAQLAELGDIYVNDAFSAAHRAHASTEGLARLLPNAAGRLMEAELKALTLALEHPERPVAAVVGGAKISTKLDLLGNLVRRVNLLALGGGMANTFLYAKGTAVGASLCEKDMAEQAREIMAIAEEAGCEILLPRDAIVAKEFKAGAASEVVAIDQVPSDSMILDIGPATVEYVTLKLQGCKTIVWNGPLGAFETKPFDAGTNAVAGSVAALTKAGRSQRGRRRRYRRSPRRRRCRVSFTYVSAAGGAFLEWLEGKDLPGVAALKS